MKAKGVWVMYGNPMQTVQVRIPKDILKKINELVKKGRYYNRSHLVREAVKRLLESGENAAK